MREHRSQVCKLLGSIMSVYMVMLGNSLGETSTFPDRCIEIDAGMRAEEAAALFGAPLMEGPNIIRAGSLPFPGTRKCEVLVTPERLVFEAHYYTQGGSTPLTGQENQRLLQSRVARWGPPDNERFIEPNGPGLANWSNPIAGTYRSYLARSQDAQIQTFDASSKHDLARSYYVGSRSKFP